MGSELIWRKSSYSGDNGGECAEVATLPDEVMVRDSKDQTGPVLRVDREDWHAFLAELR